MRLPGNAVCEGTAAEACSLFAVASLAGSCAELHPVRPPRDVAHDPSAAKNQRLCIAFIGKPPKFAASANQKRFVFLISSGVSTIRVDFRSALIWMMPAPFSAK